MKNYKNMVSEMFNSVGVAIGIHVMLLILEHSLWKTKQKYEEAHLITFSEEGISLNGLDALEKDKAELIAGEFVAAIVSTLGRLMGMQLANQLSEQLHLLKEGENI